VALEVAAGLGVASGLEIALGFGAPMEQSIGGGCAFIELPPSLLARPTKVDDLAHPALNVPRCGFGAKYAHSVAVRPHACSTQTS
jgi:hypothetical protein